MRRLLLRLVFPCLNCIDGGGGANANPGDSPVPYAEIRRSAPTTIPDGWKVCAHCEDTLFRPRGCNFLKQSFCHGCKACGQAARRTANRACYARKAASAVWRRENTTRVLNWRRNRRYGYDTVAFSEELRLFEKAVEELSAKVDEVLTYLEKLGERLNSAIFRSFSRYTVAVKTELFDAGRRLELRWERFLKGLSGVPGVVLPDHELAC